MATQDNEQVCTALIEKVTSGQSLSAAEKTHMIECEQCIVELVRHLDDTATAPSASPCVNGQSTIRDGAHNRPEAQQALEHGRRIFAREFGL